LASISATTAIIEAATIGHKQLQLIARPDGAAARVPVDPGHSVRRGRFAFRPLAIVILAGNCHRNRRGRTYDLCLERESIEANRVSYAPTVDTISR
jgi:hypothetical protein